jgi:ATP-dependent RNA helicase HelY
LIAECVSAGIFDDLEPAQLAGLLSSFVFEAKRGARVGKHPQTPVKRKKSLHDRLGPERRLNLSERLHEISVMSATVREVEERYRVPHAKEPDGKFAPVIAAWARGVTLGTVLDLADVEIGQTSPGDFVRNAKQVADLCEQLSRLTHLGDLAQTAFDARDAVLRSVVAGASTVHPRG